MADNIVKSFKDLSKVLDEVNEKMGKTSVIYSDMNSSKKGSKVQTSYFNSLKKEITGFDSYIEKAKKSVREFQKTVKDPNASNNLRISYNMLANAGKKFADVQELINRNASKNKIGKAYKDAEAYLSKALNKIYNFNVALEKTGRNADSLLPRFKKLATAFGTAFSIRTLVNFGKKVAEVRGEFELQQRALQAIIQNKQLADEIWEKTMSAALQSPFTALQLVKYTKQLAAYRIETDKLFDTTKRLADVSAGLGVDMQRLILAYGQVKAANYLRASEIRQFTEAGVNILGELRDYFNETRGMAISTADVMQMVQKRLVGFKDVEAIFKRLTDQGGIFYNMQYIQSQTLKGQINKLHDAYDQMLNDIGKSNEGVLKGFVDTLNSIVKNWRAWSAILKSIAFGSIVMYLTRLAQAMGLLATSSAKASMSIKRLAVTLRNFGRNIKGNLTSIGVGAIVALGTAILTLSSRMRENNKVIDEQLLRLRETRVGFEKLESKINANNSKIQGGTKSQKELIKAQKENKSIIAKLTEEYPQLASQMSIATNGVIAMNDALTIQNRKLREQATLLALQRQTSLFGDTMQQNLQEAGGELASFRAQIASAQAYAKTELAKIEADRQRLQDGWISKLGLDLGNTLFGNREQILKSIAEFAETEDVFADLARLLKLDEELAKSSHIFGLSMADEHVVGLLEDSNIKAFKEDLEKQIPLIAKYYERAIKDNKTYAEEIKNNNNDFSDWLSKNQERLNKDAKDGVNKANETIIKSFNATTQEQKYLVSQAINAYFKVGEGEAAQKAADDLGKVMAQGVARGFNAEWRKEVEEKGAIYNTIKKLIDFFASPDNNDDGGSGLSPEEKKNKIDAMWRRRIQLLEEMRKRYNELSKSAYGYAESNKVVRKEFETAWGQIFGKDLSMSSVAFMNAAEMSKSYETILAKAGAASKAVKDEIQKKADSERATIPIDVELRATANFEREIEKMFDNYNLTVELQNLNIGEEAAKNMFPDFEYTTLKELQDEMNKFYEGQRGKDGAVKFSEKDLEAYRKYANKVDAEIMKARKEHVKQYSKFLEKEYSDRAKLQMQHAKDVAFVSANFTDEKERDNIVSNLNKKFENELNELNWKSFKESDFYVEMMDDLTSLPADYLQIMLSKIETILQHPETLSPRALKEAINARQKVLEAQMNTDSLSVINKSIKSIRAAAADEEVGGGSWTETRKNLKERIILQAAEIEGYEKQIDELKDLQGELAGYEKLLGELNKADEGVPSIFQTLNNGIGIEDATPEQIQKVIDDETNKLSELEKQQDASAKAGEKGDPVAAREVEISRTKELIAALEAELRARKALDEYKMSDRANAAAATGRTSVSVGNDIVQKEGEKDKAVVKQQKFKDWFKSFDRFDKALSKLAKDTNQMLNSIGNACNAFYDMFEALGGETDALTEGWKDFGNSMLNTITNALTLMPQLVTAIVESETAINAAMGIIGLIAEAVTIIFSAIGSISKLIDAGNEAEIERQQKNIENLERAYKRLEKQIERTVTTASYIGTYNDMVDNINQRIAATSAQLAAEQDKKNSDDDKIQGYKDSLEDLYDELDKIAQKQTEVFGGIGAEGYRDAAEGFVDAWKDAFLETGDGLDALQDHFDEFLQEWFVKQATMRIAGNMLKPVFEQIDKAVEKDSMGGANVTLEELQRVRDLWATIAPDLNDALTNLAGMWDLNGEGGLSGLAAGIQGMTEEQANILEAYWNSVRIYTANIDQNVSRIADILGVGGVNTNPQLEELQSIRNKVNQIYDLFSPMDATAGSATSGHGLRVYVANA